MQQSQIRDVSQQQQVLPSPTSPNTTADPQLYQMGGSVSSGLQDQTQPQGIMGAMVVDSNTAKRPRSEEGAVDIATPQPSEQIRILQDQLNRACQMIATIDRSARERVQSSWNLVAQTQDAANQKIQEIASQYSKLFEETQKRIENSHTAQLQLQNNIESMILERNKVATDYQNSIQAMQNAANAERLESEGRASAEEITVCPPHQQA